MMTKQNLNPWARWKALLFIPLAALLLQAFARPEINREIEQISTLKGTEILQENTDWTEEKFLEELRKRLPEGVSRELSYEDTWKEIVKRYQFQNQGKHDREGIILAMNKNGDMLADAKHVTISDVPDLLAKKMTANRESNFKGIYSVSIDGKTTTTIVMWTHVQREVNTPQNDFQNLLNAVGDAYISKRNEMAKYFYQTNYDALDKIKKSDIDFIVPILVNIEKRGPFSRTAPPPVSKSAQNNDPHRVEMKTDVSMNELYIGKQKEELQSSEDIVIPTTFKPNLVSEPGDIISESGDKNNLFFPSGVTNTRKYGFKIFNRSGKMLFETIEPNRGWNGYFESRLCAEGAYFYIIEGEFETGQSFKKTGAVTLVKTTSDQAQLPAEEEWKKAAAENSSKMQMRGASWKDAEVVVKEFDKIKSRQITCNGKTIKVGDINSELPEQFRMNKIAYKDDRTSVKWILDYPCIVNEKWETNAIIDMNDIVSINTYFDDEAVKRYGSKAQNGVIVITTQ